MVLNRSTFTQTHWVPWLGYCWEDRRGHQQERVLVHWCGRIGVCRERTLFRWEVLEWDRRLPWGTSYTNWCRGFSVWRSGPPARVVRFISPVFSPETRRKEETEDLWFLFPSSPESYPLKIFNVSIKSECCLLDWKEKKKKFPQLPNPTNIIEEHYLSFLKRPNFGLNGSHFLCTSINESLERVTSLLVKYCKIVLFTTPLG